MSDTTQLILYILATIVVLVIYRKSKEEESLLLLKLFGFTFLGAFMLDLNGLKLPLGFAVFLLIFRVIKVNAESKYKAACLGLTLFLLGVFIPQVESMIYERTHHVDLLDSNFYSGSLVEELEHLKDQFNMNANSLELRGFDMVIDQDGTYKNLGIGLAEQTHEGTVNYSISLSNDMKSLEVYRYKVKEEDDYLNDLIFTDAELVLANLDLITESMLDFEGKRYYQLRTDGQRTGYDVKYKETFQINTAGKFKVDNSQLPVRAIVAEVCGSKELDEHRNPFKCGEDKHFLLDMLKNESVLNKSNVLDIARKASAEIDEWLMNHTGESIGYEKDGTFILIKDGTEEKVQEPEYITALKETPVTIISHDEQEDIWDVTIDMPYGDAPHILEFRLDGETRDILDLKYR
ncbi:hypothetical protein [Bacillus sp. AK031]